MVILLPRYKAEREQGSQSATGHGVTAPLRLLPLSITQRLSPLSNTPVFDSPSRCLIASRFSHHPPHPTFPHAHTLPVEHATPPSSWLRQSVAASIRHNKLMLRRCVPLLGSRWPSNLKNDRGESKQPKEQFALWRNIRVHIIYRQIENGRGKDTAAA
mmetsp:Transcript_6286/g.12043  ORF Transcript_6286/g.12043 Transcript_6286/m.12043 type:complete len:158 (-) Transcript_6286:1536-2009(-)